MERKLLITGCPRAGTLFAANVWRRAGLDFGHEHCRGDGSVSWFFAVDDDSYPDLPWKNPKGRCAHVGERRSDYEFANVWHQVRDPLKCITSMSLVVSREQWAWAARHIVLPDLKGDVRRLALVHWVKWNALCAERASWTYRVEDFEQHWPRMLLKLGMRPRPIPSVRKDTHRSLRWSKPFVDREAIKKMPDLTWDELYAIDERFAELAAKAAKEYGYV